MIPPILEFDPGRRAHIEPSEVIKPQQLARRAVLCFFQDVLRERVADGQLIELETVRLGSEIGRNPVYKHRDHDILIIHPGVGAPLAGAFLEELIAYGCNRFIACGGAGVLDSETAMGHVVVPDSAVRDEGTSYHYLPPSREAAADPEAVRTIEKVLSQRQVPFATGKTWTTDAIYRETPDRIAKRKAEGCLTVEMETAAFFAIAQFRGVQFGQLLYGGDDMGSDTWDNRDWQRASTVREKLFQLAIECCMALP